MKLDIHSEKLEAFIKKCGDTVKTYKNEIKQYSKALVAVGLFTTVYVGITMAIVMGSEEFDSTPRMPLLSPVITQASDINNNQDKEIELLSTMSSIENLVPIEISDAEITIKEYTARLAQMEYEEASVLAYEREQEELKNIPVETTFISLEEIEEEKEKIEKTNVVSKEMLEEDELDGIEKSISQGKKDDTYQGQPVKLTKYNRDLVERLVFGEAGGEGFVGAVLVAQTIRDTMLMNDIYDTAKIIKMYAYSGSTRKGTSDTVKRAVSYVFDGGGYAVKHRLIYFYAPALCKSSFHESQKFIIEWKGHKFFDEVK